MSGPMTWTEFEDGFGNGDGKPRVDADLAERDKTIEHLEGDDRRARPTYKEMFGRPDAWATPAELRERPDAANIVCMAILSGRWKPLSDRYWNDCVIKVPFVVEAEGRQG